MGFGTKKVSGNFEVVDLEGDCITLRHCATATEYTIEIEEGCLREIIEEIPLGTFFLGTVEIDDAHHC
jgi:hypothetical protein